MGSYLTKTIRAMFQLMLSGYYVHSCIKMRYKATFHPTCLLGKSSLLHLSFFAQHSTNPDPETYDWDLLDNILLARLSARKYVSMSQDRHLLISTSTMTDNSSQATAMPDLARNEDRNSGSKRLQDDTRNLNEGNSDSDSETIDSSVFGNNMPGVMTVGQITALMDLQDVEIKVGTAILNLGVSVSSSLMAAV